MFENLRRGADLLLIFPFLLPFFKGGKRKREENNQSRGQKSCLSARSGVQFHPLCVCKGAKVLLLSKPLGQLPRLPPLVTPFVDTLGIVVPL